MVSAGHRHRCLARFMACTLGVVLLTSTAPAGAKGAGDLDRVGIRETDDGVALRLYEGSFDVGLPDDDLPAKCFPNQEIQIQLSTRELATQVWFGVRRGETIDPQGQMVGTAEDEPVAVVVARVPKGVDRVEMRFAGGIADEMTPLRGGWVVLGSKVDEVPAELDRVPLLNQPEPSLGRITYFDEDDDRRTTQRVSTFGGYLDPECEPPPPPPPPLPEPTGPPPADEAAARAAVQAAYETVFSETDVDRDDRLAAVEDGESVRAASEEIAANYGDIGPTTIRIDEVRFLNETEAAVRFDILLDGNAITTTTVGRALLIDGTWKIAKATYCELLSRGGVTC